MYTSAATTMRDNSSATTLDRMTNHQCRSARKINKFPKGKFATCGGGDGAWYLMVRPARALATDITTATPIASGHGAVSAIRSIAEAGRTPGGLKTARGKPRQHGKEGDGGDDNDGHPVPPSSLGRPGGTRPGTAIGPDAAGRHRRTRTPGSASSPSRGHGVAGSCRSLPVRRTDHRMGLEWGVRFEA